MSVTTNDKLEFIYAMAKHSTVTLADCKRIMRYAATLQRLAEEQCNREWTDKDQRKRDRLKLAIANLLLAYPSVDQKAMMPVFQNDPRGAVVKIQVPDGYTNDWGKEGICVPA